MVSSYSTSVLSHPLCRSHSPLGYSGPGAVVKMPKSSAKEVNLGLRLGSADYGWRGEVVGAVYRFGAVLSVVCADGVP